MIVHAIADLHGHLPDLPSGDVLLIAGDIVPLHHQRSIQKSRDWLNTLFREWLERDVARPVVAIWGNHDFIGEYPDMVASLGLPWTLLQDSETTILDMGTDEMIRVWGSPWTPLFNNWAFNLSEEELAAKWALIPAGLDILLVHGPPHMILDRAEDGDHCGSPSLRRRILHEVRPTVTVFGHIHEAHGAHTVDHLRFFNASHVNAAYQPVHKPVRVWVGATPTQEKSRT